MPNYYPKPIKNLFQNLHMVPQKIDAAVNWSNGRSYIFAGRYFYRLDDWRSMRVSYGYPRDTATWWFGCKGGNRTDK